MIKETLIFVNLILILFCYRKIKQIEKEQRDQMRAFLKEWKAFKAKNGS